MACKGLILPKSIPQFKLRQYQEECIQASLKSFSSGLKRVAVNLPVGSGKTVIFANLINRLVSVNSTAQKILVLAHRKELLTQAYNVIRKFNPSLKLCLESGTRKAQMDSDVIIASVNKLGRSGSKQIQTYCPEDFKTIIVDEAHHITSSTYQSILNHFEVFHPDSHINLWGCSATLRRHDGLALGDTFQGVVYQQTVGELIKGKYLCKVRVSRVKTGSEMEIRDSKEDFSSAVLDMLSTIQQRNQLILKTYLEQSVKFDRKSTLIFALNVNHIDTLVASFREKNIDCRGIHSGTSIFERENTVSDFKAQKFPVLINCGILTEGVDIPNIDCLMLTRPTKSSVLLQQMLGRGMRLSEGKKFCLVLDFVDSFKDKKSAMIATIPTLSGLLKEFVDQTPKKNGKFVNVENDDTEKVLVVGFKYKLSKFSDPFASGSTLAADSKYIQQFSIHPWVRINESRWILPLPNTKTHLLLNQTSENQYHGECVSKQLKTSKMILKSDSFQSAIRGLDTYTKQSFPHLRPIFRGRWRNGPPSERQIAILEKFNIDITDTMTKGDVNNIITCIIHRNS